MDSMTLVFFCLGFVLLVGGAELLVRGASQLAIVVGISPLVVGLTVVAFGTSTPELAISVRSALAGQPDIALGNVVGSNIANVLLIIGISALILPLAISRQVIRWDLPLMIGASLLLYYLALDGILNRWEGLGLMLLLVGYVIFLILHSLRESTARQAELIAESGLDEIEKTASNWLLDIVFIIIGLLLLVKGAQWMVDGAVDIARFLGVSELIIGLTIIAVGTSLPEIAASVMACLRNHPDIVVGNVVGSNLFNILLVLGASSAVTQHGVPVSAEALSFDIPIMLMAALACWPIFFTGMRVERWEGGAFLLFYSIYLIYLVLLALHHPLLAYLSYIMMFIIFPLTVLVVGGLFVQKITQHNAMP